MLAITENAAEAIRGIVAAPGIPDGAGIRIATQPGSEQPSPANMICGEADPRDAIPPGPLAPARFLTIENPNGCLCHERLSLDTPIRR